MIIQEAEKLDNPVWHSLSESHQRFSIGYDRIKFYHPDFCPFGGINQVADISGEIAEYSKVTGNFFIVGEKPALPEIE